MTWRPFISRRAAPSPDGTCAVLPSQGIGCVEHWLAFPRAACPVSGNPIGGLVRIRYQPIARVVELVSLRDLVKRAPREASSVEGVALWLHAALVDAVATPVRLDLVLLVRPGPQIYRVSHG